MRVETRRQNAEALVRYYLAELARMGGPEVSFDQAREHVRHELLPTQAWRTVTMYPGDDLPDMQTLDHTLEMIRRITSPMSDYGSLG